MVGMGQTWEHMAPFQQAATSQVKTNVVLQKYGHSATNTDVSKMLTIYLLMGKILILNNWQFASNCNKKQGCVSN